MRTERVFRQSARTDDPESRGLVQSISDGFGRNSGEHILDRALRTVFLKERAKEVVVSARDVVGNHTAVSQQRTDDVRTQQILGEPAIAGDASTGAQHCAVIDAGESTGEARNHALLRGIGGTTQEMVSRIIFPERVPCRPGRRIATDDVGQETTIARDTEPATERAVAVNKLLGHTGRSRYARYSRNSRYVGDSVVSVAAGLARGTCGPLNTRLADVTLGPEGGPTRPRR